MTRIDHVAIEVPDLDRRVEMLTRAGSLRVLRRGQRYNTGQRIVLLGDGTGSKIELIESNGTAPRFVHLAFRVDDVDAVYDDLVGEGWGAVNPPHDLTSAGARTALVSDGDGLEVQVITYQPNSPDMVRWDPGLAEPDGPPAGVTGQHLEE